VVWSLCCSPCPKVSNPSFSNFTSILRDLARLHRRKYRGPLEIYVTSGDTIYITEAEKTFFSSSVVTTIESERAPNEQHEDYSYDANDCKGKSNRNDRKRVALRESSADPNRQFSPAATSSQASFPIPITPPPSSQSDKFQIDLPTISLESYPHMSSPKVQSSGDLKPTTSTSFHDPLLNPPPNKVNEWPCGLVILVPLRLGLDHVNPMYFEVNSPSLCRPPSIPTNLMTGASRHLSK
jgi:hypothetical protein